MFRLYIETKGGCDYYNKHGYKYQMLGNAEDNAMSIAHYVMEQMGATRKEIEAVIDAIWSIEYEDFDENGMASVRWERAGKSVAITIKNA